MQSRKTFFSSISGIKTSWRAINMDYPYQVEVNNLIVLPPIWVNLDALLLNSTQILESGNYKNLATLMFLAMGTKIKLDVTVSPEVTRILPAFAVTQSYPLMASDLIYLRP